MNELDIFDSKLLQRLTRPLVKPGVIKAGMARDIILRSQRFANRLPLLAIAQRHYNVAESQTEQLPIVYAKSQLPETAISSNLAIQPNRQFSQSNSSKTTVIQAKLASPTPLTSAVNPQVVTQSENTSDSLPLVNSFLLINSAPDNKGKNLTPQPPSLQGKGEQEKNLTSLLPSLVGKGEQEKNLTSQLPSLVGKGEQEKNLTSLQGKGEQDFLLPSPHPPFEGGKGGSFEGGKGGCRGAGGGVNKLNNTVSTANFIPAAGESIPPPLPKVIVQETRTNSAKVNTPLVFSNPSVTTPQASPEVQNRGIERFFNTPTNPGIAAVTPQPSASHNLRSALQQHQLSQVTNSQEALPQIDIDSLAAKVERKLMRKLVIENERRGGKL